ncbi:MAG TPA: hypothetical protein VK586_13790 [Streptosporangiaceae bacterium]|nr:hypothetical protein [Streptosporangiaceae bacterium]
MTGIRAAVPAVSDVVRAKAAAAGAAGWLADLPGIVAGLEQDWAITVGRPYGDATEYDLGILMREDPEDLLAGDPRDRSRWLARRCGLDETAIWEWGVVSRLETGLVCTQVGLQPAGRQMLQVADRVAP